MQKITPFLPRFRFTEAISLVVNVETQAELDSVWSKRVMQALLGMTKLDIQALKDAYEHAPA